MLQTNRFSHARSVLAVGLAVACGGALAMPFCGNKGDARGAYYHAPVYALPPVMPSPRLRPAPRPHVHSWDRIGEQSRIDAPPETTLTAAGQAR